LRKKAKPALWLLQHPDLRCPIEPLPLIDASLENRPENLQHSVNRRITNTLGKLLVRDVIGGMISSTVLALVLIRAIYGSVKQLDLERRVARQRLSWLEET